MNTKFFNLYFTFAIIYLLTACSDDPIDSENSKFDDDNSKVDDKNSKIVDTDSQIDNQNISAPLFNITEGEVKALTKITITCANTGASIFYTTDNSKPTVSSKLYNSSNGIQLLEDTSIKAICSVNKKVSPVSKASYVITPLYPDFVFELETGMRWDYTYTYKHTVFYSQKGDKSFTTTKDFSVILGESQKIDGIDMFKIIVIGDYSISWTFMGQDGYRLLGSKDGKSLQVLFDAMLGFWSGGTFFLNFDIVTATVTGDTAQVSKGWKASDDKTAYYPGVGTIHDPDAWSGYSNTSVTYKKGVGPSGYTTTKGSSTAYENKSNKTTVKLKTFTKGTDVSDYAYDDTITSTVIHSRTLQSATDKLKISDGEAYISYIVYVEFLTSDYDPQITVKTKDFETEVSNHNNSDTAIEIYKTDSQDGPFYVWVSDASGKEGGNYRIGVIPISSDPADASIDSYTSENSNPITAGNWLVDDMKEKEFICYKPTPSINSLAYYYFVIPRDDTFDPAMSIIDAPGASTSYWYKKVNQHGPGEGEAFYTTLSKTNIAINVFDSKYDTAGSIIFGFGKY